MLWQVYEAWGKHYKQYGTLIYNCKKTKVQCPPSARLQVIKILTFLRLNTRGVKCT
jgi:hypothetical protein